MRCPVCRNHECAALDLHSEGFTEGIVTCKICGSVWSINHGLTELVKDAQRNSFMEAVSECVEADDYSWAI